MSADCSYGKRKFYKSTGAGVLVASLLIPLGFAAFAAPTPNSGPAYGGSSVDLPLPDGGPSPVFVDVEAAAYGTYAVDADGNRYAWGSDAGSLGLGRSEFRSNSPRLPEEFGVDFAGLSSIGSTSGVAVGDTDGKVYTWGDNRYGQLGTGDRVSRNAPVAVDLPGGVMAVSASAGYGFTVAVGDDGKVYGWGLNSDGQLGNGGTLDSDVPVQASSPAGVSFVEVYAGTRSVLALASDGSVYTWGYRNTGNMGTVSPNKPLLTPNRVNTPAGVSFVSIFNADESGYAVTSDNVVYHWGRDLTQATGNVSPTVLAPPAGVQFVQVEASNLSLVALSSSGKVYTIGWNSSGQLGNGTTDHSYGTWVEADLPSDDFFVDVSLGGAGAVFAVNDEGDVYSWGYNGSGELGQGSFWGNQLTPSLVSDPEVKVSAARFGGVVGSEFISTSPSKPGLFTTTTPSYHVGGLVDVSVEWTLGGKRQTDVVYEDAYEFTSPPTTMSAPNITNQPSDVSSDRDSVVFSAYAVGTPEPSYQWQVSHDSGDSWVPIDGGVRSSLFVDSPVDGSQYRVVVSNSEGTVISDVSSYELSSVASSAPQNDGLSFGTVFAIPGDDAVFDASEYVSHPGSSSYSWEVSSDPGSWVPIAGATEPTLTVPAVTAGMNGQIYRITITNDAGSVTLTGGLNTMNSVATMPVISGNVEDQNVFEGGVARFTVSASSLPEPSYQWQVSEDDGASWADVPGAVKRALNIDPVGVSKDGNLYRVAISNSVGTTISGFGKLTVNAFGTVPSSAPTVEAPSFSSSPADVTMNENGDAVFTVTVTGSPAPTIQWQSSADNGNSWVDVDGGTGTSLTISNVAIEDSGVLYRAAASNSEGTVFSDPATLTVTDDGETTLAISSQPVSVSVDAGDDAVFSVEAEGSDLEYQWFERSGTDWEIIGGATSSSLTVPAVSVEQDGTEYQVEVSNSLGTISSDIAVLNVSEVDDGSEPVVSAPVFTAQPQADVSVDLFESAEFEVSVNGEPAPAIQWQFSADGGDTWEDLVDENSEILVIDIALLSMDGFQFRAVATNSEGTTVSNVSTLSVLSDWVTPEISVNPGNASVVAGKDAVFSVVAEGSDLEYQWQVSVNDGEDWVDVSDATESSLTVPAVSVEQDGNLYRVIVFNDADEVISLPATLSVTAENVPGGDDNTDEGSTPTGEDSAKPTHNTSSDVSGLLLAAGGGLLLLGGAVTVTAVSRKKQA